MDSYPQSAVDSVPGDARAFADVLRDGGFDVAYAENANGPRSKPRSARLRGSWGGASPRWFIMAVTPFNTRIGTSCWRSIQRSRAKADVRTEGIDIDLILDPLIVSRPAGCVVILDAARKNPCSKSCRPRPRSFQSTADPGRDGDLSGGAGEVVGERQREPVRH